MFDFNAYLHTLSAHNRLALDHHFQSGTCSGIDGMEDLLRHYSTATAFVLSDDVTTGETYEKSGGWFVRRTFTVFLLHRYDYGDESSRAAALNLCRELKRQLQSRLLHERDSLQLKNIYLALDAMPATEIGRFMGDSLTGLYFMVNVDEPQTLCYEPDQWTD